MAGGWSPTELVDAAGQLDQVSPQNPVVESIGSRQQIRVVATYADGRTRDVTREAFVTSGNTDVATADALGLMTAVRRGEAPILARYQGCYAATTLTVMGDRTGFVWEDPPGFNRIDELVAAKWKRLKLQPSPLCTDAEFIRRVSLDLTGLPPTAEATRTFLDDPRETPCQAGSAGRHADRQSGLRRLLDEQVGGLAGCQSQVPGPRGCRCLSRVDPSASGAESSLRRVRPEYRHGVGLEPRESAGRLLQDPAHARPRRMEATTQLFLAIRFNCNKCHDHPFERWTQDQYYETAAYFARVGLQPDPESKDRTIGGSAVEGAQPFYEIVADVDQGEISHDRTGQVRRPSSRIACQFPIAARRFAAAGIRGLADIGRQSLFCPQLREPHLGIPDRRRHHPTDRRHPRRESAQQSRTPGLPDHRVHGQRIQRATCDAADLPVAHVPVVRGHEPVEC